MSKTYTCKDCNDTKKLGTNAKYPKPYFIKKYNFMSISNQLKVIGTKKVRRIRRNYELDRIKEYIPGDDIRDINWNASARTSRLMVNLFQDERSQNIYSIIDLGRNMKMPFDGMTLLDYSINSSLVMLNTALNKDDKAGMLSFHHKPVDFVQASKKRGQSKQQ